ncbi:MAG: 4-hydroxy-3-methylbut-2-enyl diphosphate reductase, partial [Chlamydiae bacterium]|nr:4-hydroxy-3-methylbut-2-enyl diphosphate reductase [Chlamydiota bacterium]
SLDDVEGIVKRLKKRFPKIETLPSSSICYATTNRQMALRHISGDTDLVLVVGDPTSSNSNRLVEAARNRSVPAYLINHPDDIDPTWLECVETIGLSAGASTPEEIVQRCIDRLRALGVSDVEDVVYKQEDVVFQLPTSLQR